MCKVAMSCHKSLLGIYVQAQLASQASIPSWSLHNQPGVLSHSPDYCTYEFLPLQNGQVLSQGNHRPMSAARCVVAVKGASVQKY